MPIFPAASDDFDTRRHLCNRLSLWQEDGGSCQGQFKRWICNLALGDLAQAFSQQSCFFLNKFDLGVDPLAVSCLHQHWTK